MEVLLSKCVPVVNGRVSQAALRGLSTLAGMYEKIPAAKEARTTYCKMLYLFLMVCACVCVRASRSLPPWSPL